MRRFVQISVIGLLIVVCPPFAGSRTKQVISLAFEPAIGTIQKGPTPYCSTPFSLWQEPNSYYTDMTKETTNGSVKFQRSGQQIESFPDELVLHFTYSSFPATMNSCLISAPRFDPNALRFKAVWHDKSGILPAHGTFVLSQRETNGPWCEDACRGEWGYDLRIDSTNVALVDQLEITVETGDGLRVAQFFGALQSAPPDFSVLYAAP
ncbi:MAG TPA: hypothetical protein VFA85_11655 [Terriglobales bacterium]|nr:hypothetical protein [Terriglobales bacterium]